MRCTPAGTAGVPAFFLGFFFPVCSVDRTLSVLIRQYGESARGMSIAIHGLSKNLPPVDSATIVVPRYAIGSPASLLLLSMKRDRKIPLFPPGVRSKARPL